MIKHLSVLLILDACGLATSKGEVIHVAPGSDVSLKCVSSGTSGTSSPSWDRISTNGKELLFEKTAYLLVENFQPGDKGTYRCSTNSVTLVEKSASQSDTTLLFRSSGEQKAHLFCKILSYSAYRGQWSWKRHKNQKHSQPIQEQTRKFGTRLDAGLFQCHIKKSGKKTEFELNLVQVEARPQEPCEGGEVELFCSTTAEGQSVRLCWIKLDHGHESKLPGNRYRAQTTNSYCVHGRNNTFHQTDIRAEQRWTCAVFQNKELRALVPFSLNVKKCRTSSPSEQTTGYFVTKRDTDYSKTHTVICISSLLIILLLVVTGVMCCIRRSKGKKPLPSFQQEDTVVYTDVCFQRRTDADPASGRGHDTNRMGEKEDAVVYYSLKIQN
ncbi:uncharacterized protein LOC114792142 [Denticeps clupeoides]|uniref:uncharacterized protein LOC114792142 n=1 Tax=Denticeps clupeoides TaxID=299321 RepID=UPI0010A41C9C|nr:uncharacterized protein LOC114792142 [Denticeps clupeoides]